MKANESSLDRILRTAAGIILLVLYFTGAVSGILGIVLLIVGAIALITGVVGFCPLYSVLKIQTKKE